MASLDHASHSTLRLPMWPTDSFACSSAHVLSGQPPLTGSDLSIIVLGLIDIAFSVAISRLPPAIQSVDPSGDMIGGSSRLEFQFVNTFQRSSADGCKAMSIGQCRTLLSQNTIALVLCQSLLLGLMLPGPLPSGLLGIRCRSEGNVGAVRGVGERQLPSFRCTRQRTERVQTRASTGRDGGAVFACVLVSVSESSSQNFPTTFPNALTRQAETDDQPSPVSTSTGETALRPSAGLKLSL